MFRSIHAYAIAAFLLLSGHLSSAQSATAVSESEPVDYMEALKDRTIEEVIAIVEQGTFSETDTPVLRSFEAHPPTDAEYFAAFLEDRNNMVGASVALSSRLDDTAAAEGQQVVFLNFKNDESYRVGVACIDDRDNIIDELEGSPFPSHHYTQTEQDAILERFQADYNSFDVEFVTEMPTSGDFSTVTFNSKNDGPPSIVLYFNCTTNTIVDSSILLGLADGIDFLNMNQADNAVVNINYLHLFLTIDPTGQLLSLNTGLPVDENNSIAETLSKAVINVSASIGAHELGHILGLRHHDSFGAPGDGLPTTGTPDPASYVPFYNGPQNGSETLSHLMASGGSVGSAISDPASNDLFFSERSAIKLTLALTDASGYIMNEEDVLTSIPKKGSKGKSMLLPSLKIPNTIVNGINAGPDSLNIEVGVIRGRLDEPFEIDVYPLGELEEGMFVNAEVISFGSIYVLDPVFARLILWHVGCDGQLQKIAYNIHHFEGFDPVILDAEIPMTGNYAIQVDSPGVVYPPFRDPVAYEEEYYTGDYDLLVYVVDKPLSSKGGKKGQKKGNDDESLSSKKGEKKSGKKGQKKGNRHLRASVGVAGIPQNTAY